MSDYIPELASFDEVLEHYGVKGMKWGVRKDEGSGSGRSSADEILKKHGNVKAGSEEAKAYAALGAFYASLILAYTYKYVKDSGKFHQMKTKNTPWKTNKSLAKKKMSVDELHEKVVKPINPSYGAKGTKMNCRRCTFVYEMRRRGYDVKATKSTIAAGQTSKGMNKAISNVHKKDESIWGHKLILGPYNDDKTKGVKTAQTIFDALSKNPDRSRGELAVGWKMGGGHSVVWEIVDRKPVVFDTQNKKTYREPQELANLVSQAHEAAFTRLDNVKLDENFMRKWATNND